MRYRLYFILVTAFFVTMNVLLWRSEFGARGRLGTPVPAEVVWEKVLTSPDNSFLEIRHRGVKIGRAHWVASIGEEMATGQIMSEDLPPEGMVKVLTGYSLDFDGNVSLEDLTRFRFNFNLKLDTNQNWKNVSLKLAVKPFSWEVQASEEKKTVRFVTDDDESTRERTFTFADLRNPEKVLRELGGPTLPAALAAFGLPLRQAQPGSIALGLKWEAHNDRLKIGNNLVRVYRLSARLFERYSAVLFVSPVGEILRMELPDEIVLTNDALTTL
jgi:hypothetical protein